MANKHQLILKSTQLVWWLRAANVTVLVIWFFVIVLSWPFASRISARIALSPLQGNIPATLTSLRLLLILGVATGVAVDRLFKALSRIIATVSHGNPFLASNAALLRTIAWMLFIIQLLDLAAGAVVSFLHSAGARGLFWTPSITGWIAVVMVFVLAHIFTVGTEMRDELDGTV